MVKLLLPMRKTCHFLCSRGNEVELHSATFMKSILDPFWQSHLYQWPARGHSAEHEQHSACSALHKETGISLADGLRTFYSQSTVQPSLNNCQYTEMSFIIWREIKSFCTNREGQSRISWTTCATLGIGMAI